MIRSSIKDLSGRGVLITMLRVTSFELRVHFTRNPYLATRNTSNTHTQVILYLFIRILLSELLFQNFPQSIAGEVVYTNQTGYALIFGHFAVEPFSEFVS